MITSSGGTCDKFDVIGMVVGYASRSEGCVGGISITEVYKDALKALTESAKGRKTFTF